MTRDQPTEIRELDARPLLTINGSSGSTVRVTASGILVCPSRTLPNHDTWFWAYSDLRDIGVTGYGPIGVIRATLRRTGAELPLLLLDPDQIVPARRTLEVVGNRINRELEGWSAA